MTEAGESIIRGLKEVVEDAKTARNVGMMLQTLRYYANGEWDGGEMARAVMDIMEVKDERRT